MSIPTPQKLMLSVLDLVNEINLVGLRLYPDEVEVLGKISLKLRDLTPSELGFLRTVSWLYALYYEAGKVNVEFMCEQFAMYTLDQDGKWSVHLKVVHQMRTFLQHNLDPTKEQNRMIQRSCERWLQEQCQASVPTTDKHWQRCLVSLLHGAKDFLALLRDCIRYIEQDESSELILRQWEYRRKRYHPPYEFDRLISIVAADMGRESLDVVRFRNRYHDRWVKELDLQQGSYDFEVEGRKLIEHALLTEVTPVLPITGKDIIEEFNLAPSPEVGRLLALARKLYMNDPCPRDPLLARLRQEVNVETVPKP